MKEIVLPSGRILRISQIPFADAKALYQAILSEVKDIKVDSGTQITSIFKDLFCVGFSSPKIEACLNKCMSRCTYGNGGEGDLRIDKDTFEDLQAREDYSDVCMEVTKEVVSPFGKSLFAAYSRILKEMGSDLTSRPQTTT